MCVCARARVFDVHEDAFKQEDEYDIGARRYAFKQEDDDAFKMTMLSNSLVHVVMYYYYMLVTLGKPVWWKKYLTVFQVCLCQTPASR